MADKIDGHRLGLTLGVLISAMHAAWALWIAVAPATLQSLLDWVFALHFLQPYWTITAFNAVDAVLLVAVTFVAGYAMGWTFADVWNLVAKKR